MSARGTRGAHARSKDTRGGTRSAPNPNQPTIVRRCNEPCTYLSDGGVSDNLGLEVVWRNHGVLLVSNGGQPFRYGWRNSHLRWVLRCTEVAGHQVDRLRVQWLLYLFRKCHRMGAYWGIGNTASSFGSSSQHWPTYSQTSVRNYISKSGAQTWTDLQTKKARSWKITAIASQRRRLTFTCCATSRGARNSVYPTMGTPTSRILNSWPRTSATQNRCRRMTSLSGGISRTAISASVEESLPYRTDFGARSGHGEIGMCGK